MKVATYNVHRCVGTDGLESPERILQALKQLDADVYLLQEVGSLAAGPSAQQLVDWFARSLKMYGVLGSTCKFGRASFGNACLSRKRPDHVVRHDLSVSGREPRGLLELRFSETRMRLRVLGTHLGLGMREREQQYRRIGDLLRGPATRLTILGGDFNDLRLPRYLVRNGSQFASLPRHRTFPSRLPLLPLDRIHVWPYQRQTDVAPLDTGIARVASDHLPLVSTINCDLPINDH